MRKSLLLISLLLVIIFTSAFSVGEWRDSIYDQIRTETVKALRDQFKREITVGSVDGRIVGQVVFHDVNIHDFATAKKVYINYSLIKFAYKKDIVPAITKITIEDGDFKVRRDRNDQLNVLNILPQEKPGDPPPPPFRAKLVFKNCSIDYRDFKGFRKDFVAFHEKMTRVKGTVDFSKKDRIKINISGNLSGTPAPSRARISGTSNLKKETYFYKISANRLDLRKWGNYALPLDIVKFEEGKVNLTLRLSSPRIKGRAVSLSGDFSIFSAGAKLYGFNFKNTSGRLTLKDNSLAVKDARAEINGLKILASGRLSDFERQNLDFKISFTRGNLKNLVSIFPQTRDLELSGLANASVRLRGTANSPIASGKSTVLNGQFYGQSFSGTANLAFAKKLLKIDIPSISLYKGKLSGECNIDFSRALPVLSIQTRLNQIDLAALSQNSPGIIGKASGNVKLYGPANQLRGELEANLSGAQFLGQPIEKLSSLFVIRDGDVILEHFTASSKTASIKSTGTISRDLRFNFQSSASGIELSGNGLLGPMAATVDSFEGNINFKLDEDFLAAPLKRLNASGSVKLSDGEIGEQRFDLARGKITLGDGLIEIEDVSFIRDQSMLKVSGQTGIGHPTNLTVYGSQIDLDDLKILNLLLPKEAKDPTGFGDISFEVTGELSKETQLTSFDPLLNLNAGGTIRLTDVNLADLSIKESRLNFKWENRNLSFPDCMFKTENSDFKLDLTYSKDEQVKGSLNGVIDFSEFRKFTNKYGQIDGKLGLNLIAEGDAGNPGFAATFWLEDFRLNKLDFDRIEGSLSYANNILNLSRPVHFTSGENEFVVSGSANLNTLKPDETSLDLKLKVIQADLSYAFELADKVNSEVSRRLYIPEAGGKSKINLNALAIQTPKKYIHQGKLNIYSANGKKDYFLKIWGNLTKTYVKKEEIKIGEEYGGELSGDISLKGKINNLSGNFNGEVEKGYFRKFTFDKLRAKASLKENKIEIEHLELSKKFGRLNARGDIGLGGNINLDISATRMPLDILKILFDQEYKGTFNLRAAFTGSTGNPQFSAAVKGDNLTFAGIHFDKTAIAVTKTNGHLKIHEFSLYENGKHSSVAGTIDLSSSGSLDLEANLLDNAVGLFNLISKDVRWIKGKAKASITLVGPLTHPRIDGNVECEESSIYVKAIDSEIKAIKGSAKIIDGIVQIPSITANWQGVRTKGYPNFIGLAGSIDISRILDEDAMVSLNLALSPYPFYVDLPNLYTGVVDIKAAQIYGPLYFDLSAGPTLKGKAKSSNAIINISKRADGRSKIFPVVYDLDLSLGKNVYAVMGDVATFDLSNIFMNLEISSDKLLITGTSANPSLFGNIAVKRGTVSIFNREFTLLNVAQQEGYYEFDPDKVKENTAFFSGEEGGEGVKPDITITAKVDVEESETKVIVISRLQGVIGAAEKERGLTISLDSFVRDKDNSLKPGGYSEQAIKVMLLPDFIKSLTGVEGGDEVDASLVVADYISSRVQTLIFRGLERELEQRFGLESLTLEYNFGKDIRQAMGVTEARAFEGEKPDWRVGFVKGFFDKVYIDVKYSQFNQETGGEETYLNYQLTYKLSPIWSIIYYREPTNVHEIMSGDEKITLKAGFSFW